MISHTPLAPKGIMLLLLVAIALVANAAPLLAGNQSGTLLAGLLPAVSRVESTANASRGALTMRETSPVATAYAQPALDLSDRSAFDAHSSDVAQAFNAFRKPVAAQSFMAGSTELARKAFTWTAVLFMAAALLVASRNARLIHHYDASFRAVAPK